MGETLCQFGSIDYILGAKHMDGFLRVTGKAVRCSRSFIQEQEVQVERST